MTEQQLDNSDESQHPIDTPLTFRIGYTICDFDYEYGDERPESMGMEVGRLFDEGEYDFDEHGLPICAHCSERIEYPYDKPHDCIECYYCGERDMCVCDDINDEVYCEHCAQPWLDCDCPACDDCGLIVYDCGCEEDYCNDPFD